MKKRIAIAALVLAVVGAYAQGMFTWVDKVSDDKDKILPGVKPSAVTGTIITAGSSTVFPLSEAIAEQFKKDGFKGQITIDSIGSGAGFERFTKTGETDISNASRAIKSSEVDQAKAIGRNPIGFIIGTDALAVVVSRKNTFVTDVTAEELAKIFSTAVLWSDVRPEWPKREIKRFSPGTDSGTFDYFVEHVLNKKKELLLGAKNVQLSEDDNVLVRGVKDDPYAVGYFGAAYLEENKRTLKGVAVNGATPTEANALSGKYVLARPLFLYSDAKIINDKPQVAAFLTYYLTYVNTVIKKVGYFPAKPEDLKKSKQALADAMKGRF